MTAKKDNGNVKRAYKSIRSTPIQINGLLVAVAGFVLAGLALTMGYECTAGTVGAGSIAIGALFAGQSMGK